MTVNMPAEGIDRIIGAIQGIAAGMKNNSRSPELRTFRLDSSTAWPTMRGILKDKAADHSWDGRKLIKNLKYVAQGDAADIIGILGEDELNLVGTIDEALHLLDTKFLPAESTVERMQILQRTIQEGAETLDQFHRKVARLTLEATSNIWNDGLATVTFLQGLNNKALRVSVESTGIGSFQEALAIAKRIDGARRSAIIRENGATGNQASSGWQQQTNPNATKPTNMFAPPQSGFNQADMWGYQQQQQQQQQPQHPAAEPMEIDMLQFKCYACNKVGHLQRDCYTAAGACFRCGGTDHWISECTGGDQGGRGGQTSNRGGYRGRGAGRGGQTANRGNYRGRGSGRGNQSTSRGGYRGRGGVSSKDWKSMRKRVQAMEEMLMQDAELEEEETDKKDF